MSHRLAAKITGVAGYVPPKVMTNADLEKIVETNDEWIRTRTGIRERHVAENGTATSQMATEAAKVLLAQTGTDPAEIDLIVLASVTPDMFFPDRKSTRLNSSHVSNSYAVFCLKKKMFTFGESNPDFPNPQKVPIWADDCVLGSFANVDPPYCLSPHTARAITTPQFIDNLTWVHGAHTIRAGFNFRFYIHNDSRGFFGSNVVEPIIRFVRSDRSGAGFSNIPGAIAGNPATTPNSTDINHLRQAILELAGIPSRIQQAFLANFNANSYGSTNFATVYSRAHQYDSYIQDEWKLRPNRSEEHTSELQSRCDL